MRLRGGKRRLAGHGRRPCGRWPLGLVALMAAAVMAAGCTALAGSTDESSGEGSWPPSVPQIDITLQDDAIEVDRPVPGGRVVFRVHNAGSDRHRVTLMPLPEDLPPLDEQLAGDERRGVRPMGATNTRPPGQGTAFAVDLEQGRRYGLVCFERTDDGTVHARTGENAEFRAGGPDTDPPDQPLE